MAHCAEPAASRRGFTLIEVLIAVAVLSVGIVLVLQGLHAALAAWDGAVERLRSVMLAQEQLAGVRREACAAATPPEDNSGSFAAPFARYRWRTQVAAVALPGLAPAATAGETLYDVRCTVWRELSAREFSLATRLYVPARESEAVP